MRSFLRRHQGLRVLYLELGVGGNTPGDHQVSLLAGYAPRIPTPFTSASTWMRPPPRAELAARSLCIDGDIGAVLARLRG